MFLFLKMNQIYRLFGKTILQDVIWVICLQFSEVQKDQGQTKITHMACLWLRLTPKASVAESKRPSDYLLFIPVCLLLSFSEECCGLVSQCSGQHFRAVSNDSCLQADFPHFPQLGPPAQKAPTNSKNQSKCMKTCRWL